MSTSYWTEIVEAEQLTATNVLAATVLLRRYGFEVTEVEGDDGVFLLYEQRGPKLLRGFVRPGQWIHLSPGRDGTAYVRAKTGPPPGPLVKT